MISVAGSSGREKYFVELVCFARGLGCSDETTSSCLIGLELPD